MKKLLLILLVSGVLLLITNLVFSFHDFKEVPVQLEVSVYDSANDEFGEAVLIDDQEEIEDFIQSVNKAGHENGAYEVTRFEDYKVRMVYKDGSTDTLRLWLNFGDDFDMFQTDKTVGIYKLKNDGAREVIREILE
ncbi:hypothetical protein [Planococcus halotolerans]|uniref:YhfM-like domain-containing protein n=1 Tax=Planococcus halotolerans TaxID=2233542 RepID=A0A365L2E1_9BACL|nr:hypothetical protein [Planococcus halotolerans]QHJ70612.1 hypothetical protein DNR44_008355 [Planococcus halotolerans]RAZ79630.1 hypothetical protein DP120_08485 [Planococcus halotolerans]